MSDSLSPVGDGNNPSLKQATSHSREIDEIGAVPIKRMKHDSVENNITSHSDAHHDEDDDDDDILEEEEDDIDDLDQEDFVDGDNEDLNEEIPVYDIGESSDIDEYLQNNLSNISDCQTEIEALNKQANNEILKVEKIYNHLRLPVYAKRNEHIAHIPYFWCTVFSRHPQLKQVITSEDLECLRCLTRIQVEEFEEGRSGYEMRFYFTKNSWFSNKQITKEYHLPWNDVSSCACTPIKWYPGKDLTLNDNSFFTWFSSQDDASTDDIAEIIKEELWLNPLSCYAVPDVDDESYKSGDEVTYVSSDDDEWKKKPVLGKEGPSTSKDIQYLSDEESEDLDEAELSDDDEDLLDDVEKEDLNDSEEEVLLVNDKDDSHQSSESKLNKSPVLEGLPSDSKHPGT